jgi:hypothetical protein
MCGHNPWLLPVLWMTSQSKPTRKGKSPQRGKTDAHRLRCEKNLDESNPAYSRTSRINLNSPA